MAYNSSQKAGESLEHWYRRLAKTADQRLVRLESYQHDKGFQSATRYAYRNAIKMIEGWSGEGARRFNTEAPKTEEALRMKIGDIRAFLEKPTSTKQGIITVYKKRADTINEKSGTSFTWEDLADFLTSEEYKKWDEKFGSKTAFNVIAVIQKSKNYIRDNIKQVKQDHLTIPEGLESSEKMLRRLTIKALKDSNLKTTDLIRK